MGGSKRKVRLSLTSSAVAQVPVSAEGPGTQASEGEDIHLQQIWKLFVLIHFFMQTAIIPDVRTLSGHFIHGKPVKSNTTAEPKCMNFHYI